MKRLGKLSALVERAISPPNTPRMSARRPSNQPRGARMNGAFICRRPHTQWSVRADAACSLCVALNV